MYEIVCEERIVRGGLEAFIVLEFSCVSPCGGFSKSSSYTISSNTCELFGGTVGRYVCRDILLEPRP